MYFTQEDYKKIENWLHRNSVKDTEFQEALPFTGKEIVTVVQDGHNRKVNIQEFINQLYKHGVEDFLNVTNTYRANNITLKEAISLIPAEARKEGQVITFLNTDGNWEIYQFIGKLNQWNNPTLWNNPFDWEKFVVDSILPDEEDLTKSAPDANGNAYLSLKNRKYEPDKYSGLGRKILRKRVVEIEDPIYGTQEKNLLLQADFAEDNTVYVVRYDFTLNGQDITLPDNSYIEYEGGSISDGNIIDRAGGLNRVILKKNIVNGKNILTQEMVSIPNTIYEIRYDFDLNSEEITIPKNCILDFNSGSISKGTIIGNKTAIKAPLVKIFELSIILLGTWNVVESYPEWFGALADGINDDREAIQNTINYFKCTRLCSSNYILNSYSDDINKVVINLPDYHSILGRALNAQHLVDTLIVGDKIKGGTVIKVNTWTLIDGIDIKGNNLNYDESLELIGIGTDSDIKAPGHVCIRNVKLLFFTYGILLHSYVSTIEYSTTNYCVYGIHVIGTPDSSATSPRIIGCGCYHTRKDAYKVYLASYALFENCYGDRNGINLNNLEEPYYPVYTISNTRNSNIISCSAEQFGFLFNISNSELNIIGFTGWPNLDNLGLKPTYLIYQDGDVTYDNVSFLGSDVPKPSYIYFNSGKVAIKKFRVFQKPLDSTNHSMSNRVSIVEYTEYPKIVDSIDNTIPRSKFTNGIMQFLSTINKPIFYGMDGWFKDANGYSPGLSRGDSSQRPNLYSLKNNDYGYQYYDDELKTLLFATIIGEDRYWKMYDGAVAGVKRFGPTSDRHKIPSDIYPGFLYFDETINKPIWWTGSKWVDATGADV